MITISYFFDTSVLLSTETKQLIPQTKSAVGQGIRSIFCFRTQLVFVFQSVKSRFMPQTPTSDRDRISPYNIDTISSRQVMRIQNSINKKIIS